MKFKTLLAIALSWISSASWAQTIQDDFEGNGNIHTWFGDACGLDTALSNPFRIGINNSLTVLEYRDNGGQYANIRFDAGRNLNLSFNSTFSFKIYVPSSGLTGNQPNQVSLKLQDGNLAAPWSTQSEIIKPIALNQWQTVTFDFASDPYINLNSASLPPTQRTDFNRVLIQVNGENNNDHVLAYIDDFYYYDTLIPPINYNQLVWADEFNGTGALDTAKWFHQTQLPAGGSWFNGEIQHYTNRTVNSIQQNGHLHLIAKKETFRDQGHTKQYTSARLNSKFAFTYGRVEVKAKLPTGVGTWPAIWLLGKNINEAGAYWQTQGFGNTPWPACGEMDIMEHWGRNQNYVSSATHTPSSFGSTVNVGGTTISTVSTNYHVYAMEWSPNKLVFSVDSVVHYVYQPSVKNASTWPFDLDQYILLNIAIEASIAPSFLEDTMSIDYVRVYQASTVGLYEYSAKTEFKVFPNPVQDILSIRASHELGTNVRYFIYNINGMIVKEGQTPANFNEIEIGSLNSLSKGLYMIQLNVDGEPISLKFVKE